MSQPLLSVIIPHTDTRTSRLTFLLLWQCQQQKLCDIEVVVVNTTDRKLADSHTASETPEWLNEIREVTGPAGLTRGAVLNIGLQAAKGEFVCCIDPETYLHPDRLLVQTMRALVVKRPVVLRAQSLIDVSACTAADVDTTKATAVEVFERENPLGLSETLLFPRLDGAGDPWLFDIAIANNEHAELYARLHQFYQHVDVIDNIGPQRVQTHGWPFLAASFYYGQNKASATDFFRDTKRVDVVRTPGVVQSLASLLRIYGFQVA